MLILKHKGIHFQFETNIKTDNFKFNYTFSPKQIQNLVEYLTTHAETAWKTFEPKEAMSLGSDCFEYYDKKLDCNGYLFIDGQTITFDRPNKKHPRLYNFTKKKLESFVYDLSQ